MNNNKQITIKDVAEKAGCSTGTVDRVLHNRGRVSETVKKRILETISDLDYKPNVSARVLASNHPLTIGILLPSFSRGEYWELPNKGIQDAIDRYAGQGFKINIIRKEFDGPQKFYEAGIKLLSEDIDGIIMSPVAYRESVRLVRAYFQCNKPFILIDSYIHGIPASSFIGKDPVQSGLTAGKLLHQVTRHIPSRKSIWIIHLAKNLNQMYSLLARESGFMNYFSEKELQDEYAFKTFDIEDRNDPDRLRKHMEGLLSEEVPHAIYVSGSRVFKVAESIHLLGLEPRPLIIGHDLIRGNVEGMKEDVIDFLIEEEARRQGLLSVETLYRQIVCKEKIDRTQLMNLLIYTKENLPKEYL
jgi:LacI family transcriptional regulator